MTRDDKEGDGRVTGLFVFEIVEAEDIVGCASRSQNIILI